MHRHLGDHPYQGSADRPGRGQALKVYHKSGGWEGFTWGGLVRRCFLFSDTLEAVSYLNYSSGEGYIEEFFAAANLAVNLAGIVCVANRAGLAVCW